MGGRALSLVCIALVLSTHPLGAQYTNFVVERDVMIEARDGVALATDIYRPANGDVPTSDRLPLLLQRTPYGKHTERFVQAVEAFTEAGYVVALQDVRGRYASEGTFVKYHDFDAPDGFDTIEWLAALPYVNGVGMWGTSYGAHTQADASKLNPPSLGTMVLNMGGMTNAWDHAVRQGGAFELGRELTWAFRQIPEETDDPVIKALFEAEPVHDWYNALPLRPGLSPLAAAPDFEKYILDEQTHGDYGEFWKRIGINWVEYYEGTADIPMLHVGGWYDIFLRGTVQNYVGLSALKTSPVRMLVGPWTHGGNARTYAGDVDFGPDAAISDFGTDFHIRWFDHFLKDRDNDLADAAPVRLFVMGGGGGHKNRDGRLVHGGFWTEVDAWPPPGARSAELHLGGDGSLRSTPPTGQPTATTYLYDPSTPVPTLGGHVSSRLKDGAFDQRERPDFPGSRPPYLPLRSRADVVVFQTEPLEEDTQIAGPIEVHLFVSSSAVDTDFTVKLVDVYPPSVDFPTGFDMNITDAVARMSYRNGRATRDLIEPGEVYELVIQPFPTANLFKAGHRIRVDVSSSNFPRWDVNPNTGEPLGRHRRTEIARNTVYHSEAYPSRIILPVTKFTRRAFP